MRNSTKKQLAKLSYEDKLDVASYAVQDLIPGDHQYRNIIRELGVYATHHEPEKPGVRYDERARNRYKLIMGLVFPDTSQKPDESETASIKREIEELLDIPAPVGQYIIDNTTMDETLVRSDGNYYHYVAVVRLLKSYKK